MPLEETDRILNILMLTEAGLLQMPLLYLSRYFIVTKSDYYKIFLSVTANGTWSEWINSVAGGVHATAGKTARKISDIQSLQQDYTIQVRGVLGGSADVEFLSVSFEHPYCRISTFKVR